MQLKIGDKIVEVDMKSGVPVIKATSKEIKHKDGRIDVSIFVPCLKIKGDVVETKIEEPITTDLIK